MSATREMSSPGRRETTFFAFGVQFRSRIDLPGVEAGSVELGSVEAARHCRLRRGAVEAQPPGGKTVLREWRDGIGRTYMSVHETALGYILEVRDIATFFIASDGARVDCQVARDGERSWRRFLVAQVLPMVAVLNELEALHASAVRLGRDAFVLSGPSGAGKSTLAAVMARLGAEFMADDVAALEAADGRLQVHPGVPVSFADEVSHAHDGLQPVDGYGEPGFVIPRSDHAPSPLRAVYLLEPVAADRDVTVERDPEPDPRVLLGAAFALALRDRARLRRQLDCCAAILASAEVVRVTVPRSAPEPTAEALMAHARGVGLRR